MELGLRHIEAKLVCFDLLLQRKIHHCQMAGRDLTNVLRGLDISEVLRTRPRAPADVIPLCTGLPLFKYRLLE